MLFEIEHTNSKATNLLRFRNKTGLNKVQTHTVKHFKNKFHTSVVTFRHKCIRQRTQKQRRIHLCLKSETKKIFATFTKCEIRK